MSRRAHRLVERGGIIALAVVAMNVGTYGFQIISARFLGPTAYGSVASMLALTLVVSVAQLGLQTTAARRIAAEPSEVADVEHAILALGWRLSSLICLACLVASPLIERMLNLESIYPALILALSTLPMNLLGAQMGILQGERRWGSLATVYLAAGIPRFLLGVPAFVIRPTEGAASVAITLGWVAPCAVAWWFLRRGRHARPARVGRAVSLGPITREVSHAALALLAFYALANIDILTSRHVLSGHDSGLYAGGLILTKAVLFLPQFVTIVAFPAMSTATERRRVLLRSLGLIGALGAVCVLGSIVLSPIAMIFVGGDHYASIEGRLWLFALLGTIQAALQLLVYAVLARQSRRSGWLLWAAAAAVLVAALEIHTLTELVVTVTCIDAVLLALLVVTSLRTAPGASVGGVVPAVPGADTHV